MLKLGILKNKVASSLHLIGLKMTFKLIPNIFSEAHYLERIREIRLKIMIECVILNAIFTC